MRMYLKIVLPAIIITSLFACTSKQEKEKQKLQSAMTTYFKANMMDSTSTLDSFRLVKMDTVTQKMALYEQSSLLLGQVATLVELSKLNNEDLSNSIDKMRLYSILNSRGLVEVEKNSFDRKNRKGDLLRYETDTLLSIARAIDSATKKADSVSAIGFQARCFYQLRRKDQSVQRDTAFIFLNTNKDIIKRSDLIKLPYYVDFDKF